MFEKFKERIQQKIEKNSVKSNLIWTDKEGQVHEEEVILKRSQLPLVGDWGRIYPPVNEDGSWNIINLIFGGRKNFIKLLIILGLIAIVFYGFYDILAQCKALGEQLTNQITFP